MQKNYFIHDKAIVETLRIGKGTKVWAFAHILPNAVIGEKVNICDLCFIENNVVIGNNVTVKSGVYLWDGITIEDDVFIGPSATFTNDLFPRSKNTDYEQKDTLLKKGCSIGANSTILPGTRIGEYAMVGAGAVVTKNVGSFELVYGNPAKKMGYICVCGKNMSFKSGKYKCVCGREYNKNNTTVKLIESK